MHQRSLFSSEPSLTKSAFAIHLAITCFFVFLKSSSWLCSSSDMLCAFYLTANTTGSRGFISRVVSMHQRSLFSSEPSLTKSAFAIHLAITCFFVFLKSSSWLCSSSDMLCAFYLTANTTGSRGFIVNFPPLNPWTLVRGWPNEL